MAAARFYSSNAATTTLTGGIGSGVTSIVVGAVTGFPSSFPYTLILDPDGLEEVVTVSAGAGTTLTVARGADGTSAIAHDAGVTVRHGVSARDFREPQEHIGASADVHGLTGGSPVAGTTQAQTLTNKTISGSANTLSNIAQASVTSLVTDLAAKTTDLNTHMADTSTHGVAVAVVGTTDSQTLTNKTLTTPTIASLTNAQHDHSNAAGGGVISIMPGYVGNATDAGGHVNLNVQRALASYTNVPSTNSGQKFKVEFRFAGLNADSAVDLAMDWYLQTRVITGVDPWLDVIVLGHTNTGGNTQDGGAFGGSYIFTNANVPCDLRLMVQCGAADGATIYGSEIIITRVA